MLRNLSTGHETIRLTSEQKDVVVSGNDEDDFLNGSSVGSDGQGSVDLGEALAIVDDKRPVESRTEEDRNERHILQIAIGGKPVDGVNLVGKTGRQSGNTNRRSSGRDKLGLGNAGDSVIGVSDGGGNRARRVDGCEGQRSLAEDEGETWVDDDGAGAGRWGAAGFLVVDAGRVAAAAGEGDARAN